MAKKETGTTSANIDLSDGKVEACFQEFYTEVFFHTISKHLKKPFSTLTFQVKQIEKRDSVLTSKQQIDRILRPGSSYFNLNPFEVLQINPEIPVEDIKKKYKQVFS